MRNPIELDTDLLENVMDALDRLFDGKSDIIDVQRLLFTTFQALPTSYISELINQTNKDLKIVIQKSKNKDSQREDALNITNELRIKLAELLDE